jgi:GYF domain 2
MKKYFLHDGTESSGPFDFEELIAQKITPKTPVWFEGMDKWKFAGEIPELQSIFKVSPPPLEFQKEESKAQKTTSQQSNKKIFGLSRPTFFIICAAIVLLAGISYLKNLQENRSRELRIKNHKTEVENYQLELKEKELEEQKKIKEEAEKAAAERALQDQKEAKTDRIIEVDKLIAISQSNLEALKRKLANASGFKILRTSTEKKEELNALQLQIDSIYKDIDQLKIESNQLKLDLEKIPE